MFLCTAPLDGGETACDRNRMPPDTAKPPPDALLKYLATAVHAVTQLAVCVYSIREHPATVSPEPVKFCYSYMFFGQCPVVSCGQ